MKTQPGFAGKALTAAQLEETVDLFVLVTLEGEQLKVKPDWG